MDHLLRPRIWPSSLASSAVGSCDVPFRYASASILDFGFRISDLVRHRAEHGAWRFGSLGLAVIRSVRYTVIYRKRWKSEVRRQKAGSR
jgi:hypothetical protein